MFLQRNLRCFYCGSSSLQKRKSGLRQWQCSSCKAINYLDERGNITDPPVSDTATPPTRYATRGKPITSPELGQSTEGIFCNTCVKNQYLVAHNLAEYLPEPDDPRYAHYEKTLPQYRASLEARYPQVCRNCEPRVRERLKLTGYAAKTDHLRRLAESTRQARSVARGGYGLSALTMGGGICWWLAHISQIFWHARNLSRLIPTLNSYPLDKLALTDDMTSLLGTWSKRIDSEKVVAYSGAVSIAFTLCSIWWNPVLTRGSRRNWRGLGEFYKLQAVLMVTRLASWQLLESGHLHDLAARRAIHAAALGFNLFVLLLSQRTIKPAPPPEISFEVKDELVSNQQDRPVAATNNSSTDVAFPIEKFRSAQSALKTWSGPPTPPPEDLSDDEKTIDTETVDSDAMDLDTPERMQMNWTSRRVSTLQASPRQQEQSPFRGHLPPAPVGPAHKLRNPPNKPSFQKVSDSRQRAFFDSMTKNSSLHANQSPEASHPSQRQDIQIAPPQFFASGQEETGLESLFTGLISLSDEPSEIRQANQGTSTSAMPKGPTGLKVCWTLVETTLAISAVAWAHSAQLRSSWDFHLRAGILTVIFVNSLFDFYDNLRPSKSVRLVADILVYMVETVFSGGLLASHYGLWQFTELEKPVLQDLEKVLLWFFALQRFFDTALIVLRYYKSCARSQPQLSDSSDRARQQTPQSSSKELHPIHRKLREQISAHEAEQANMSFGRVAQRRQATRPW